MVKVDASVDRRVVGEVGVADEEAGKEKRAEVAEETSSRKKSQGLQAGGRVWLGEGGWREGEREGEHVRRIHKIPTSQPDGREEPVEGGRDGGATGETVPEGGEERDSLLHGPVESLAAVGGEEEEV